jgi:hypothetical protein
MKTLYSSTSDVQEAQTSFQLLLDSNLEIYNFGRNWANLPDNEEILSLKRSMISSLRNELPYVNPVTIKSIVDFLPNEMFQRELRLFKQPVISHNIQCLAVVFSSKKVLELVKKNNGLGDQLFKLTMLKEVMMYSPKNEDKISSTFTKEFYDILLQTQHPYKLIDELHRKHVNSTRVIDAKISTLKQVKDWSAVLVLLSAKVARKISDKAFLGDDTMNNDAYKERLHLDPVIRLGLYGSVVGVLLSRLQDIIIDKESNVLQQIGFEFNEMFEAA